MLSTKNGQLAYDRCDGNVFRTTMRSRHAFSVRKYTNLKKILTIFSN
ncbi:hypothetical protein GCWU000325_02355 [Alloprevotella tannerae ATCC 51259]|uniref:Uncharacterized protein n=1 Tax=Alloprevotella tannerae ATCC 51259 TaxID=626522 RepID=C9LJE3_9BACT|nr:hypothetical protein GCWU000325_02355 [Alloprevotella tannerae ATCC 51259]